jgi:hypothetical protein
MTTNAIIPATNLKFEKVTFGDIRVNKAGGKTIPIKYDGQALQIRIPKMMYPMGILIKDNENGTSYTLSATLRGCDHYAKERAGKDAGDIGTLYNFILDLQEGLLKTAMQNSTRWFGKSRTEDVMRALMKQSLSPSVEKVNGEWVPSGKYPPSLRMKVPVYDGDVAMDVADGAGKSIQVTTDNLASVFPKRVEASLAVAPSVYISGQGFGITWRVTYARVSPPQRLTAAQVFADEIEEEIKAPAAAAASEDQEEESAEQTVEIPSAPPAPEPPAPAATKNRRRQPAAAL